MNKQSNYSVKVGNNDQNGNNNTEHLRYYFAITVIPVGIVLNVLSAYIFRRNKQMRNNSFAYLYSWLCVFDTLAIASEMVFAVGEYLDVELTLLSDGSCRVFYFWKEYVNHLPSYLELTIVVCLYAQISYPLQKNRLEDTRIRLILVNIGGTLLVDLIYFTYHLQPDRSTTSLAAHNISLNESTSVAEEDQSNQTVYLCTVMLELDFVADVINLMMRDLVPFFAIFVLNTLSMIRFRRIRATTNANQSERKSNMFFIAIFASNIIFLLIYTPWSVCFLIHHLNESFGLFASIVESKHFLYIWDVVNSFAFLNNITPFFIHATFNSLFRNELCNLIKVIR